MKILITEDNEQLHNDMQQYLENEGFVSESAKTLAECRDKLVAFQYDLLILDLMLPDGNGLDIVQFIKDRNISVGILIASAKDTLDDKVQGLNLGADDYITKPFFMTELVARLKAIYRRKNFEGNNVIQAGNISIDTDKMEVRVEENLLDLTKKEYDLLMYFIANKNRVLTKMAIAEHLWGDYADSLDSHDFVYQHIKNLRKKITQLGGNDFLKTIYGAGYKFSIQ